MNEKPSPRNKNKGIKFLLTIFKFTAFGLLFGTVISFIVIYCNDSPSFQWDSTGFNNFTNIYRFPISLLIALFAVITLHVTIKRLLQTEDQLKLLNRQISSARQPQLYLKTTLLWLYTNPTLKRDYYISASRVKDDKIGIPYFNLFNLGLGSAVDIKYKFLFDSTTAIDLIKKVNELIWFNINNEIKDYIEISHTKSTFKFSLSENKIINTGNINFITSIRDKGSGHDLHIPMTYFNLYTIYLSLLCFDRDEIDVEYQGRTVEIGLKEFPKLNINFKFKDIANLPYETNFEIKISFKHFSNPFINGQFRFTENFINLEVRSV